MNVPTRRAWRLAIDPAPGQHLGRDPLRLPFHRRRRVVEQRGLTVENLLDALAQRRPPGLGDIEASAEVEQGALSDLLAVALAAHQAVRVVGLPVDTAGLGAAHEHGLGG